MRSLSQPWVSRKPISSFFVLPFNKRWCTTSFVKGEGHYNSFSKPQQSANEAGLQLLKKSLQELISEGNFQFTKDEGLVISDYGSSQGKNSAIIFTNLLKELRPQMGPSIPVSVYHNDLPGNDWNALFSVCNKLSYGENTFSFASGTSFYEQVLPPRSVHLAWSTMAFQWLSKIVCPCPVSIFPLLNPPEYVSPWSTLAAQDWERIVQHRAREMKLGGKWVMVNTATKEDGRWSREGLYNALNTMLQSLVHDNLISQKEFLSSTFPFYARTKQEFFSPLQKYNFKVNTCQELSIPDPYYQTYLTTKNKNKLCHEMINFTRSWSEGLLNFDPKRSVEDKERVVDELYKRLGDWVEGHCDDPTFGEYLAGQYYVFSLTLG